MSGKALVTLHRLAQPTSDQYNERSIIDPVYTLATHKVRPTHVHRTLRLRLSP